LFAKKVAISMVCAKRPKTENELNALLKEEGMSDDQALIPIQPAGFDAEMHLALNDVAGQIAESSQRIYRHDAAAFATWLRAQGLAPQSLEKSHMVAYRAYLASKYAKSTASRMLSVARQLLDEAVERQQLEKNPASSVRGFSGEDETTHLALTDEQAQALLDIIPTNTLSGQRDYTMILLLLRTGIRRSEAAALRVSDLSMRQGHHVAIIRHGKGDKRRIVKVPVDVRREIDTYLEQLLQYHTERCARQLEQLEQQRERFTEEGYLARRETRIEQHTMRESDGLFVRVRRGEHPTREALTDRSFADIVEEYARQIEEIEELSPHGLRASFITLTLESGSSLEQTQYAAGHSDPRTTQRYRKRKLNLDHNAVDTLHFAKKQ
jgi:integrase/recombinase XerD